MKDKPEGKGLSEHRYLHSVEQDEVELKRLGIQAEIIDPISVHRLETVGIVEGWKCLEVGAGAGSIARWLSTRVGPSGKVVATDIDLRFLRRLSASNLEIRQHNILEDVLEKDHYDLVHCRCLLMHLPEPEKALRKMADAVRPGGWLLVEEHDWGSCLSADVTDPSTAPVIKIDRIGFELLRKRGIVDNYFGRRVRGLVEQLGYSDVGHEGYTYMVRGSDPIARSFLAAGQPLFRLMIKEGLLTEDQYENAERISLDPAFNYPGPTLFSAWGRKPV
jgi:SAM-dependent methyltransferase